MIRNKKILIIGSGQKNSLEYFYKKAFYSIGIKKIFFFSNSIYFYLYCLLSSLKINFLYKLISYIYEMRLNLFLKDKKNIDLIVIFKGIEINTNFLIRLKNKYPFAKVINIFTDDPFNFTSVATSSAILLDSIPIYNFFFIWSKKIEDKLKKKYKFYKNFYYLPFGWHKRASGIKKNKIDINYISFIGSGDRYRENIIKKFNKIKLYIFGKSWNKNIANHSINTFVDGVKFANVINKSFVSINILRKQNLGSHNMRTFEIPAMGGLLAASRSNEQNLFFPENRASIMFNSVKELENKIFFLRNNQKVAEEIRKKGFKLSLKHSYKIRAKYLLKIIYDNYVK
jgi:spore maturation protein CgeB